MLTLFAHRDYARLFAAQVVALIGTGLLTVALGLLAYDLAGPQAGLVLGTAYTIKMVAYVGLSPVAQAVVQRLPRKAVLIGADMLRAGVALCLPFVT
ncbi:MAG: MFS transporter, partial [Roseovarius sp.]